MSKIVLPALKGLRQRTGLSYFELATASGLKPNTLIELETRLSNPTSDTLLALIATLAQELGQSASDTFDELIPDVLAL